MVKTENKVLIDWFMRLKKTTFGRKKYPFNTRYTLSTRGHVYDTETKKWLRPIIRNGTFAVKLKNNEGNGAYHILRVMVAETYLAEGQRIPWIRAIDGNKYNTHFSNLELKAKPIEIKRVKNLTESESEIMFYLKLKDNPYNPKFFRWLCAGTNQNFVP